MAPKKSKAKSAPKAQIQDMKVTNRPVPPAPTGKSPQAQLLTLVGVGATLLGLALTVTPKLSWQAAKVMVGFDYLGVHGGALVMGGLVLVGTGMVLRQLSTLLASLNQSSADTGLMENVAADVLSVGSVLETVESAVDVLKGELNAMKLQVADLHAQAAEQPEGMSSEDALFRMAASLDKVGAKIEERLKSQFTDLSERIDMVEASVKASVETLNESVERIEESSASAAQAQAQAPLPGAGVPQHAAGPVVQPGLHHTGHYPAPGLQHTGHYPAPGLQHTGHYPAPELHQTQHQPMPGLHQTQHHQVPGLHQTQHQPAPVVPAPQEDPNSLGVLDQIDDDGVKSPLPQTGANPFVGDQVSLEAPPPTDGRWDEPQAPNQAMSDPDVRRALEDMGRQG